MNEKLISVVIHKAPVIIVNTHMRVTTYMITAPIKQIGSLYIIPHIEVVPVTHGTEVQGGGGIVK